MSLGLVLLVKLNGLKSNFFINFLIIFDRDLLNESILL